MLVSWLGVPADADPKTRIWKGSPGGSWGRGAMRRGGKEAHTGCIYQALHGMSCVLEKTPGHAVGKTKGIWASLAFKSGL